MSSNITIGSLKASRRWILFERAKRRGKTIKRPARRWKHPGIRKGRRTVDQKHLMVTTSLSTKDRWLDHGAAFEVAAEHGFAPSYVMGGESYDDDDPQSMIGVLDIDAHGADVGRATEEWSRHLDGRPLITKSWSGEGRHIWFATAEEDADFWREMVDADPRVKGNDIDGYTRGRDKHVFDEGDGIEVELFLAIASPRSMSEIGFEELDDDQTLPILRFESMLRTSDAGAKIAQDISLADALQDAGIDAREMFNIDPPEDPTAPTDPMHAMSDLGDVRRAIEHMEEGELLSVEHASGEVEYLIADHEGVFIPHGLPSFSANLWIKVHEGRESIIAEMSEGRAETFRRWCDTHTGSRHRRSIVDSIPTIEAEYIHEGYDPPSIRRDPLDFDADQNIFRLAHGGVRDIRGAGEKIDRDDAIDKMITVLAVQSPMIYTTGWSDRVDASLGYLYNHVGDLYHKLVWTMTRAQKNGSLLIVLGPPDVGKSTLFALAEASTQFAWGGDSRRITDGERFSDFDIAMTRRRLVYIDEAGSRPMGVRGETKSIDMLKNMTGAIKLSFEEKFMPKRDMPRHANIALLTNYPPMLEADAGMRRRILGHICGPQPLDLHILQWHQGLLYSREPFIADVKHAFASRLTDDIASMLKRDDQEYPFDDRSSEIVARECSAAHDEHVELLRMTPKQRAEKILAREEYRYPDPPVALPDPDEGVRQVEQELEDLPWE